MIEPALGRPSGAKFTLLLPGDLDATGVLLTNSPGLELSLAPGARVLGLLLYIAGAVPKAETESEWVERDDWPGESSGARDEATDMATPGIPLPIERLLLVT